MKYVAMIVKLQTSIRISLSSLFFFKQDNNSGLPVSAWVIHPAKLQYVCYIKKKKRIQKNVETYLKM